MTPTPAPDASPFICGKFDCRDMRVCRNCGQLFGPCHELGCNNETVQILEQLCSCQGQRQSQPRWPRYDFNEAVTFCFCCSSKLLPSGSKWSVWFCDECKARVDAINDLSHAYVIPIGRHSMMASKRSHDDPAVEALASTLRDIGQSIELLTRHEKRVIAGTWEELAEPSTTSVPLVDYLTAANMLSNREATCFAELCRVFEVPTELAQRAEDCSRSAN